MTLSNPSEIHLIRGGVVLTDGITIAASKIGLVVVEQSTLRASGDAASANYVISASNQNFLWLEGAILAVPPSGTTRSTAVTLTNINESRFFNFHVGGGINNTIYADNVNRSLFYDGSIYGSQWSFLVNNGSRGNVFKKLRVHGNTNVGLWLTSAHYNVITELISINNASGSQASGGSSYNTYSHVTSANSTYGFGFNQMASQSTVSNLMSVNNNVGLSVGFSIASCSSLRFHQIALTNNDTAIYLDQLNSGSFTGHFLLGQNSTDCSISAGTNPGLQNAGCDNQGASTAVRHTGKDSSGSFFGKVTTTDSVNTNNSSGLELFASILDFSRFENAFRIWGLNGSSFPNADHRGACTSGNCRIWDFRLVPSDTQFLDRAQYVSSVGDAFISGSACPGSVSGTQTITDQAGRVFLVNATEILGTGGNDNGLCESSETCLYAPNFGAYQGNGIDYDRSCKFQDGTITGVTMHPALSNGAG